MPQPMPSTANLQAELTAIRWQLIPKQPIHISAQTYLIEFYQSLGFICEGEVYGADTIAHIDMILSV